jgi:hypothetical protein
VAEGEAETAAQSLLDALDLAKCLPRIRAFVVAVLDDERSGRRTADVIDRLVKGL